MVLLAQHLEASNLQDFWAAINSCKDTIKQGEGPVLSWGFCCQLQGYSSKESRCAMSSVYRSSRWRVILAV